MKQTEFGKWLDNLLTPKSYRDFCPNAICVEASENVERVVTGVSFRSSLIDKAIEKKADTIIVHHAHGFWNNESRLPVGILGKQIQKLFLHGISLYGFHLPLDGHAEIGNNVLIAKALGAKVIQTFMREGEHDVACMSELPSAISSVEFVNLLDKIFPFGVNNSFFYGNQKIHRIAICSGGGASGLEETISLGADTYLTGEIKETTPILAEEYGINLVTCGHHRTETFGVCALAKKIQDELGIFAEFIDIDNPI